MAYINPLEVIGLLDTSNGVELPVDDVPDVSQVAELPKNEIPDSSANGAELLFDEWDYRRWSITNVDAWDWDITRVRATIIIYWILS